jgi:hypothetical protein
VDGNTENKSILNDDDDDGDSDDDDFDDDDFDGDDYSYSMDGNSDKKPLPAHKTDDATTASMMNQQHEFNTTDQDNTKDNRQVLRAIGKLLSQFVSIEKKKRILLVFPFFTHIHLLSIFIGTRFGTQQSANFIWIQLA